MYRKLSNSSQYCRCLVNTLLREVMQLKFNSNPFQLSFPLYLRDSTLQGIKQRQIQTLRRGNKKEIRLTINLKPGITHVLVRF